MFYQNWMDLQLVIELTEIQQMQSKESFSQFEHKVFKSKLNGLIENGAPQRNKNVHVRPPRRRPCFNCGENNHSQNQCRFNKAVR
jgi:hypothetical protein